MSAAAPAPAPGAPATASSPVTPVQGSEQIVPVSSQTGTSSGSADSNFPIAAIALISIIAGVVAIFIAYKVYRWYYRRSGADQSPLPETRIANSTSGGDGFGQHTRSMSAVGLLSTMNNRQRQESWTAESSLNEKDWSPTDESPRTLSPPVPAGFDTIQNGSRGSLSNIQGMNTAASRASLASSAGAPRRSFYGMNAQVGSGPLLRSMPSSTRLNGAPHSPHSRVDVTIPSPLAPPPGTVIAKTKSALDFSPSSGISPTTSEGGALSYLESALANVGAQQATQRDQQQKQSSNKLTSGHRRPPSSSSSSNPSPSASSTGLRSAYQQHAPAPIDTRSANSVPASHSNPTSPLDRLQQRIVQQARMSSVIDGSVESGSSGVVADQSSVGGSSTDEARST